MSKETKEGKTERLCPKDCTKCGLEQHAFCAAQMAYYLMEKVHKLESQLAQIHLEIGKQNEPKEREKLINPLSD